MQKTISELVKNLFPNRMNFWVYQLGGWTGFFIFMVAEEKLRMVQKGVADHIPAEKYLSLVLFCVLGCALSYVLRLIYREIYKKNYSFPKILGIILLFSILFQIVHTLAEHLLYGLIVDGKFSYKIVYLSFMAFLNLTIPFGWSIMYFGIKFGNQWILEKERADKANLLAQSAQLQMLRYQLNPHFLFNSLNSIRALISEDQKVSKQMVTELAEFLRYSLVSKSFSNIPLREEIEAIEHYFALEHKRFEEKLVTTIEIDRDAEEFPVLSFLLNPLVENAVKYGMSTSPMPLRIAIKASVKNETLKIQVSNTGKWRIPTAETNEFSTGTGLGNIRLRLENAFPNRYIFEIGEVGDSVVARIEIRRNPSA
jgi:two-component system, LytTR family, sensor kinase